MAEQGRIVTLSVGATGSRGPLTGNADNTSYRASYDPGRLSFNSFLAHPSKTGFTSNQRPAIYYKPSLDLTDNPQFGHLLSDSFMSQTKLHYQPHIHSDCSGSMPNIINKPRGSGYHQLRNLPKTVSMEEKTEYQRLFVPHRLTPTVSQHHVIVGPKVQTGFTQETDLQLNTFQDKNSHMVELLQAPGSVMKTDFKRPSFLQCTEATANLCSSHFSRESGYTRGATAPLAWPSSLLPSPQTKSTAPTERTIGKKEPTGHLLNAPNNQVFPNTPFDGSHFTTHYNNMFCHDAGSEKLKSGHTCSGIFSAKRDSGFSRRSGQVHL
ncbi:protein phosphatase 1 regulatory subunit 32 isoform X2 [Plectropomus leopardus]|uniref:protein phosphatase 1 regulatory subunit 32 isoform X2 n=1 Tax=Plectropomus leopardus TaxID=160734 RepID=UPI001C4B23A9|nr:protein phosphatase 1 regulatory subunit 32 isoform X2 [Plectropomus leopardus]